MAQGRTNRRGLHHELCRYCSRRQRPALRYRGGCIWVSMILLGWNHPGSLQGKRCGLHTAQQRGGNGSKLEEAVAQHDGHWYILTRIYLD